MVHDAPAVDRKDVNAVRLRVELKRAFVQLYGLRL